MITSSQKNVRLYDLVKNHPIKMLHVQGAHATSQLYEILKSNGEYHWMSLPEIATFPKTEGFNEDVIQDIINYKKNICGSPSTRYQSIDVLFNTFLHTSTNKTLDEIEKLPEKDFHIPNGFFDTYIIHTPEFGVLEPKSDTVLLSGSLKNSMLSHEFNGILKVQGWDGVGWTIGYFKDFENHHIETLFGKVGPAFKERLKHEEYNRGNHLQGDFPRENGIFSPLSLGACNWGLSLETFPFYNHDGRINPAWSESIALYPIIKIKKD